MAGALGRMGALVCEAVTAEIDLKLVEAIDPALEKLKQPPSYLGECTTYSKIEDIQTPEMDVLVDFTRADIAYKNIMWAIERGVHCVVGTTGISGEEINSIKDKVAEGKANVIIASNFAIGAVLMMKFSEIAANFYDRCEIVELHHAGKLDAPSGTALSTAEKVDAKMKSRGIISNHAQEENPSRGMKHGNIFIHSVRLDGFLAHQEVIFGSRGETLKIRHDTIDRSCFMPGVILAVRSVSRIPGLTIGMEKLLGI